MPEHRFHRYRDIISEWPAFLEACTTPLPTSAWINTLRVDPATCLAHLSDEGIACQYSPLFADTLRFSGSISPGSTRSYLLGLYHLQEEAAMLPILLAPPRPGEHVLDLCAAPGNKAALMAVKMNNRGTIIANDINPSRTHPIKGTINRLGLTNVGVSTYNAASFPVKTALFDYVLADVPCSCEGTVRKNPVLLEEERPVDHSTYQRLQWAILQRAIACCKPGGHVVYATCTFAPEENEAIVDAALRAYPEMAIQPMPNFPPWHMDEGLTTWNGENYHPSLRDTIRIWPHKNNSGGFYFAVLRKERSHPTYVKQAEFQYSPLSSDSQELWHRQVTHWFGIPQQDVSQLRLFEANAKHLSIVDTGFNPPKYLDLKHSGLHILKRKMLFPKLTTEGALFIGTKATRQKIALDKNQLRCYLQRETIRFEASALDAPLKQGYVLLYYQSLPVGIGILKLANGKGIVESLFPKNWSGIEVASLFRASPRC